MTSMTNNFNPDQLRGTPKNKGSWAANDNGLPEATLGTSGAAVESAANPESPLPRVAAEPLGRILSPGTGDYLNDAIDDGPIQRLYVARQDDVDGVEQYTLTAEQQVQFDQFVPENVAPVDREAWVERHIAAIGGFIEKRYNADLTSDDNVPGTSWAAMSVTHNGSMTEEQAFDKAWNDTAARQLFNESDPGTFGTENLDRLVKEYLEETSITNVPLWDSVEVPAREIDMSVELRAGEREISDRIAAGIAADMFGRVTQNLPAIRSLATRGYANKEALNSELSVLYQAADTPRKKERVNMMFTWNQHGGDNT